MARAGCCGKKEGEKRKGCFEKQALSPLGCGHRWRSSGWNSREAADRPDRGRSWTSKSVGRWVALFTSSQGPPNSSGCESEGAWPAAEASVPRPPEKCDLSKLSNHRGDFFLRKWSMNLTIKKQNKQKSLYPRKYSEVWEVGRGGEIDRQPSEWQRVNTNSPCGETPL